MEGRGVMARGESEQERKVEEEKVVKRDEGRSKFDMEFCAV